MSDKKATILIVDDEEATCDLICEELAGEGYDCDIASNADEALAKLKRQSFDMALLDIKLPGISGIDLLKTVGKCYQTTAVVMITGVHDVNIAIETMKLGASDYIVKPFTLNRISASIAAVLTNRKPHGAVYNTIPGIEDTDYGKNFKGRSFSEINAIAYGVDAQIDYFDFHSKIVTDKTVKLAHCLGLSAKEIEKWAVARHELYSERDRRIKSTLNKLERNPMAQAMLGLTHPVYWFPEYDAAQN
ncbi:response regulator [Chloroflexota bacterium]